MKYFAVYSEDINVSKIKRTIVCFKFPCEMTFLFFDVQERLQSCVSFVEHSGLDHKNMH